jgi:hypothetical protein
VRVPACARRTTPSHQQWHVASSTVALGDPHHRTTCRAWPPTRPTRLRTPPPDDRCTISMPTIASGPAWRWLAEVFLLGIDDWFCAHTWWGRSSTLERVWHKCVHCAEHTPAAVPCLGPREAVKCTHILLMQPRCICMHHCRQHHPSNAQLGQSSPVASICATLSL